MKNFLFAFIVFLIYSLFGMWYHACVIKGLCSDIAISDSSTSSDKKSNNDSDNNAHVVIDNLTAEGFIIRDNTGNAMFSFKDNLKINNKEGSVLIPQQSMAFKDSIFNFLNKNQDKELLIIGLRNTDENFSIGLERANEIKAILEDFGINSDRLTIEEAVKDFAYDDNGNFSGGINFITRDLSLSRLSEIESGIANRTLYSGFGSKQFRADKTLEAYALELKNYLDKYPSKKVTITGHTDSVGDDIANDWFGMERAKNVRNYLASQGIDIRRLTALSKGEKEPIDTNGTLEGRRKNRRIEIKAN